MTAALAVNEIFETIQGEGSFTGTPAVFVRLQGCSVGCPWCDTRHTWDTDRMQANRVTIDDMLVKKADSSTYALMMPSEIANRVRLRYRARHVVITGGEPCAQDIDALTRLFDELEFRVQIETSGTYDVHVADSAWVTVSPKVNMPGGLLVRDQPLRRADEIKMPVGRGQDIATLARMLNRMRETRVETPLTVPVYLQPLSQSPKATALCIEAATEYGWRVSLQTHKYLGLR